MINYKRLQAIVDRWSVEALSYRDLADTTWAKLESGELPQDDHTIYSVYIANAKAFALLDCAKFLSDEIKRLKAEGE